MASGRAVQGVVVALASDEDSSSDDDEGWGAPALDELRSLVARDDWDARRDGPPALRLARRLGGAGARDAGDVLRFCCERPWLGAVAEALAHGGGGDVDAADARGDTPLHLAARADNARALRALLRCGADARATDHEFLRAPLHVAAARAGPDAVRELLRFGDAARRPRHIFNSTSM